MSSPVKKKGKMVVPAEEDLPVYEQLFEPGWIDQEESISERDFEHGWVTGEIGDGTQYYRFKATSEYALTKEKRDEIELRYENYQLKKQKKMAVEEITDNKGNSFIVSNQTDLVGSLLGEYGPGGVKRKWLPESPPSSPPSSPTDSPISIEKPTTKESRFCDRLQGISDPPSPVTEGIRGQLGLPILSSPGTCNFCRQEPCVVERFVIEVQDIVEGLEFSKLPDHSNRKELYRFYANAIYGPLGKGVRKKHSYCVVDNVRRHFPSPDGSYMGHKEKANEQEAAVEGDDSVV